MLFLLPLGLVLFILGYALRLATRVAQPISEALHLDQLGDVAGIGITTVVGVLLLVLVSFAAGLIGRTSIGGRISGWFEGSLLSALPQYQMLKSMTEGLLTHVFSMGYGKQKSRAEVPDFCGMFCTGH